MKFDAVIFDVDGTLWDTTDQVATAWNLAAKKMGITDYNYVTGDMLKNEFGKPANIITDHLFPKEDSQTKSQILARCCEYEEEILKNCSESMLYPGVSEVFEALSKKYNIYIVSNCQSGYIELFLSKNHLKQYVTDSECYGDTLLSKGENLKLLMARNNIRHAIYVGDTMGDYQATVAANIPFVYARYGFGENFSGTVKNPYKTIDDILEVLKLV